MKDKPTTFGPSLSFWSIGIISFCTGLLATPTSILLLSRPGGSFAILASAAPLISIASWGIVPLVVLLLFFGDRKIGQRPVYAHGILFSLAASACVLVLFGVNPEAPFISFGVVAIVLLYSHPVLVRLVKPLISAVAGSRTQRLYLFLSASAFATFGGVISATSISLIADSIHALTIMVFFMAGTLAFAAAAIWKMTATSTDADGQTSTGREFLFKVRHRQELLIPVATIFLVGLLVGINPDSFPRETRSVASVLILLAATTEIVVLIFLARRTKRGLLTSGQLSRFVSVTLVPLSLLHIFAVAADAPNVWLTLQFSIGLLSGILIVSALAQLGNQAFDSELKTGKNDVAKYFLLAFGAAYLGTKANNILQAAFELSGVQGALMNATLTALSATLILFLAFKRNTDQGNTGTNTNGVEQ